MHTKNKNDNDIYSEENAKKSVSLQHRHEKDL